MPFTKTWNGSTSGDYSNSLNWNLISLRNSLFEWTASGSGTNEYYAEVAGGGDPGFVATPPTSNGVYIAGSAATKGTLGALTAGQWGYGDNDTLGFDTVYVRLSGGGDPDAQTADHVQFRQIPQATESVRLPAGSGDISTTSALDQSAVAIEDFIIEEGYEGTIGSATGYLRIDPNKLEDHGRGQVFIDIGAAAITCVVNNRASASDGEFGHNLRGSAIALVDYRRGLLGIAPHSGETSAVTALICAPSAEGSGYVKLGKGATATTVTMFGGTAWLHGTCTTINKYTGIVWLMEAAGVTTVTQWSGEFHYGSSAGITTFNLRGGLLNEQASNAARTIGTLNKYRGSSTIVRNKECVTHTSEPPLESYTETISG